MSYVMNQFHEPDTRQLLVKIFFVDYQDLLDEIVHSLIYLDFQKLLLSQVYHPAKLISEFSLAI